jgi:steroid delta-isomerase-like uncharacterized protein
MFDDPETVIRNWFEQVWNQGDATAIGRLFAEDGVAHGLADAQGNEPEGPRGFMPVFELFRGALSDIDIHMEDVIVQGDTAAARFVVHATHTGDSFGFPATGKTVVFTGMTFVHVREGKIVEGWNNLDFASLYKQIT